MKRWFGYLLLAGLVGCVANVNDDIQLPDGESRGGSLNTVNGSIYIGQDCSLRGTARTVNGRIEVGSGSEVEDLQSVNGAIHVSKKVRVSGDISTVNGVIDCDGAEISGRVEVINGKIDLRHTTALDGVRTINGDVTLAESSRVKEIIIKENTGDSGKTLSIRVGGGSIVEQDIISRDPGRRVTVYLTDGGKVLGEIKNAEVVE